MLAYILRGRLYGKDMPATFVLHQIMDEKGQESDLTFENLQPADEFISEGFSVWYCMDGLDRIWINDGCYEIISSSITYPVLSLISYRITDKDKLTINSQKPELSGKDIPYCDLVYAVVSNQKAYEELKIVISGTMESLDPTKWPPILRNGNQEEVQTQEGNKILLTDTYPKEPNWKAPTIFHEIPLHPSTEESLDHMDQLQVFYQGICLETLYWDQISKIWYKKIGLQPDMLTVKGGQFTMGDYRGKLYASSFGTENVNMKKTWLNVLDPAQMGEVERGKAAIGKKGLRMEDSLAKNPDHDMWCFNSDAIILHEVALDSFKLCKYQTTFDQFYEFIHSLNFSNEKQAQYEIEGVCYPLHEVAARYAYYKQITPRHNGWGLGQRPATDICWSEALEYCNWLSRKNNLEVCYDFIPVYDGKEGEGLTNVLLYEPVKGSYMQKLSGSAQIQLVAVHCDLTKKGFRLPTEAELEYVLREGEKIPDLNGQKGALFSGTALPIPKNCNSYSWQRKNVDNPLKNGEHVGAKTRDNMGGNGYTSPVGSKFESKLGFFDLSGNAWDMVWDFYNASYFGECSKSGKPIKNPQGPIYTTEQFSYMDKSPVDPSLEHEYLYGYQPEENGSFTRTSATSLIAAGKTMHVLKGGCFSNPYPFTCSLHRHSPGGAGYFQNYVNYTNARISFRIAQTI
jgi:formylglycine-generating enzyme required for sulfatase activity